MYLDNVTLELHEAYQKTGLQFSLNCYEKLIWLYRAEISQDTFNPIFFNNFLLLGTPKKTVIV